MVGLHHAFERLGVEVVVRYFFYPLGTRGIRRIVCIVQLVVRIILPLLVVRDHVSRNNSCPRPNDFLFSFCSHNVLYFGE